MTIDAQRHLAVVAAEDGQLQEADDALSGLISQLEGELRARPGDGGVAYGLCRCLVDRAGVRAWAVRPTDALADLARAEPLVDGLKPMNRRLLRVNLLDTRARLLAAPFSPVFDRSAAQAAVDQLREIASPAEAWIPDVVEMQLASDSRDWPRLRALAPAAVARLEKMSHTRGANASRIPWARACLEMALPHDAEKLAAQAYAFFVTEGPPDITAQAAICLARARGGSDDWGLAEHAVSLIEQLTRSQHDVFDQQRYLVDKLRVYEDALRLALEHMARAPAPQARAVALLRAWQVAEQAKSFSLREAMTESGSVQPPPRLDLTAVLRSIPREVGVVSLYWLEGVDDWQLHIFYVGADRAPHHAQTAWTHSEVAALMAARRAATTSRAFMVQQPLPAAFGDRVFPPAMLEAMTGCHTLLITPHRHLRQLPLHAAQVSAPPRGQAEGRTPAWLIDQFAVQVLPTLALPFPPRTSRRGTRQVLLMGCRQDGFGSPALDDVPIELASLTSAWRGARHRVESHDLRAEAVLAQHVPLARWPEFDVIHLACHGHFVAAKPFAAALYLGSEALQAEAFFGVRLRAQVVCLSACDVGQHSDELDGLKLVSDEWLGLALPLFQAGALALVASLWKADSATARVFMADFHQALARGLDAARAHQEACRAQLNRRFGFWANWQLAGFPTDIQPTIGRSDAKEPP